MFFLLIGAKENEKAMEAFVKERVTVDDRSRWEAVKKFKVLWDSRYHVWPRMEERAQKLFNVNSDTEVKKEVGRKKFEFVRNFIVFCKFLFRISRRLATLYQPTSSEIPAPPLPSLRGNLRLFVRTSHVTLTRRNVTATPTWPRLSTAMKSRKRSRTLLYPV